MSRRRLLHACAVLSAVLSGGAGAAETAYVIDKLLVGVHADQTLKGKPSKLLPTGTRLDVLKREGNAAFIKEPGGMQGWVDSIYLMAEQPAAAAVAALTREVSDLKAALARSEQSAAASRGATAPAPAAGDGAQKTNDEISELNQRLASERLRVGELQAQISQLQRQAEGPDGAASLARENAELRERLARASPGGDGAFAAVAHALRALGQSTLALGLLAGIAAASFAAGVAWLDRRQRSRHGGFRI
ncbi:MAG: TIGR04211 family SH3 domain-containing protein [Gammaproteobacteria bacterium]